MSAIKYVPVQQGNPALAAVEAVPLPESLGPCAITPELWGIIQNSESLTVRQHVKILPKKCCACPPCVKQENTYSIYAGITKNDRFEIMRVDEISDDWNRCCCAPYHPFRLEVREFVPMPGSGVSSDWEHLSADFRKDLGRFNSGSAAERQALYADVYKQYPPLMSIVRNDGQRCCCKCPCKWLSTFVCCSCCQDGVSVYVGALEDRTDGSNPKEIGRPYALDPNRLIATVTQPIFGGYCHPEVHVRTDSQTDIDDPFAKIQGPCVFGGWSEMCCDFKFPVSFFKSPDQVGDVALIVKQKPSNLGMAVTELISDADIFSVQFNLNQKLTASQKIGVLAGQLLIDYMLFDGNTEKCVCDDDGVTCYLCYCSIFGCLCPCYVHIPNSKNDGN